MEVFGRGSTLHAPKLKTWCVVLQCCMCAFFTCVEEWPDEVSPEQTRLDTQIRDMGRGP